MFCVTEERAQLLNDIAVEIGAARGYDDVGASYTAFGDFKLRWARGHRWIEFEVSDYLADATEGIIRAILNLVFDRIAGEDAPYPEEVKAWLTSDSFARDHRAVFVERHPDILMRTEGKHRDLADSVRRLTAKGLLPEGWDPAAKGIALTWMRPRGPRSVGSSSALFRVAAVTTLLDAEGVTDDEIDLVVFAQLCRIAAGFMPEQGKVLQMVTAYPDFRRVERLLIDRGLSLEVD